MQWARAGPARLVLRSATVPPARMMPSQIATYSGRFAISSATTSPIADALRQCPAGIAAGALDQRRIGQAFASEISAGLSAWRAATVVDEVREQVGGIAGDRPGQPKRAHRAAQKRDVVAQILQVDHGRFRGAARFLYALSRNI